MLTSSAIKAHARTLGFDVCGIAPATALPELARLHDWLARGHHGEMSYLARTADVRTDIQRFLPGARSVIVTGTNYWTGPAPPPGGVAPARVARYAHGEDYHVVLAERLDALLAWMRGESGETFQAAPFVDKHWVQERVFAAYAGLGWIGKHSLRHQPRPRIVAAAGRRRDHAAARTRRAGGRPVRCLHAVPRCLSDRRDRRPARGRRPGLSQLPDHRARRASAGARPRRCGRSPLRL